MKGTLASSERVEVHEATLPPSVHPHAVHHHVHSAMWLNREGRVELTLNGTSHVLDLSTLGFAHSSKQHGIKNVARGPAIHSVAAIGPGADTQP